MQELCNPVTKNGTGSAAVQFLARTQLTQLTQLTLDGSINSTFSDAICPSPYGTHALNFRPHSPFLWQTFGTSVLVHRYDHQQRRDAAAGGCGEDQPAFEPVEVLTPSGGALLILLSWAKTLDQKRRRTDRTAWLEATVALLVILIGHITVANAVDDNAAQFLAAQAKVLSTPSDESTTKRDGLNRLEGYTIRRLTLDECVDSSDGATDVDGYWL